MKPRTAVVGAGITGVLTAYYLHQAGDEVVVFEADPGIAMACTRANGGQLSVCNSRTWNTPANLKKGIRWMLDPRAPLLIRPSLDRRKITWLAGFLWHTFNGTHDENTRKTVELGLQARQLYQEIAEKTGIFYHQKRCGILNVYTSAQALEAALDGFDALWDAGLKTEVLSPDRVLELEPALRNFRGLVGGVYTRDDSVGDAHVFTKELAGVLMGLGVEFVFGTQIETVERRPNGLFLVDVAGSVQVARQRFDRVVFANGYQLQKIARQLGDFLNIYPVKGYSITLELDSLAGVPSLSILDDERKIVSSTLGRRLRVAGTAELDGDNRDIRWARIEPLLSWVKENFPQVDPSSYFPWACHRPMSSNMMPIIEESSVPGVWYHGGHGHLGWTLGAATAQKLVEKITRGDK